MCQRVARGYRWTKCGHFQRQEVIAIVECQDARCARSVWHPKDCRWPECQHNPDWGDQIEYDTERIRDYCWACKSKFEREARERARQVESAVKS
ncbi:hypothetical protein CONPUDRAFT_82408 [Coniophora puteana RWD-64-598 SS2]|uniref:Uncharacterized protein n=1 Tax=Coniophora puteana (strain RWD-64-598) TaxID=741705 RepID=A0A5M3MR11_CONPW|nr:uncharacterized protein CONPUDRAFT_82408 [Coniophora puteana RWD-64-598 SS2]EIW81510.1 hypothetical protein CONPUDRAFT_82408 [Coniophora puteana RWD-64-598 SS2]